MKIKDVSDISHCATLSIIVGSLIKYPHTYAPLLLYTVKQYKPDWILFVVVALSLNSENLSRKDEGKIYLTC